MKTFWVNGVEHVEVPYFSAEHQAVSTLAGELGFPPNGCGLCARTISGALATPCCPTNTGYLVRADLYHILKMRVKQ